MGPQLAICSFGEVAARVAAAGEPRCLIQGLWPADADGVLAAQEKAGKTWAVRFARLIQRRGRELGGPAARAALAAT